MTRITWFPDHRRQWLAAALIPLALAACGGKPSKSSESADLVQPNPASTPVIPVGQTLSVSAVAVAAPRVVSYEEAESLFKAGKFAEAKSGFAAYTESKPENAWGHYMLGLSAWKSGSPAEAEHAFEAALAKDPAHVKSLLNSARVLLELGRGPEALERVNTARALDSTSSEAIRVLARVQDELGDAEAAIRTYRDGLVRDERDVWAMNNLGMLYIRQRDFASALPPLARAVQLRPNAPVFQNNLGIALELTGHPFEARRAYEDAIRADSSFAKALANAKRLGDVVPEADKPSEVNLRELAEAFRQQVRAWKDSLPPR
jgi:tetratricopeptide (TPR) repeat protein